MNLRLVQSPACMPGSGNTSRMSYLNIDMSPKPGNWLSARAGGWPVRTAETAQHSLARPDVRNIFSVVSAAFTVPGGQWDIKETKSIHLRNLFIIGKRFLNWRQLPALTIMNAENVIIKDNEFFRDKFFVEKDTLWLGKKIIRIINCENVEIGSQKFDNNDYMGNIEVIDSENIHHRPGE